MTTPQFSRKILGKPKDTRMVCHRISVKFYEKGIIVKPIGPQGIGCIPKYKEQINNQKPIFLTNECVEYLMNFLTGFKKSNEIADTLIENNKQDMSAEEWNSYMNTK